MKAHGDRVIVVVFLLLGAILFRQYVHDTPFDRRTHDLPGHLEYVDYVYERGTVPPAKACWECYHPPAYYFVAAATLGLATHHAKTDVRDATHMPAVAREHGDVLQGLSAVLTWITLLFALLAVREMARSRYEQVVASAVVTFWPALTIEGCKIGNDALFYLFAAATTWLLVRWRCRASPISLMLAAAASGFAACSKLNGLVMMMAVGVAVVFAVARDRVRLWRRATAALLVLGASALAVWFTVYRLKQGMISNDVSTIGREQRVDTSLSNFITVTIDTFKQSPYAYQAENGYGREQFWNYLLRTSLFGEERPSGAHDVELRSPATALCLFAMMLLPFVIAGLVRFTRSALRRDDRGRREIVLVAVGLLSALVMMRLRAPYVCTNDFRYVLPVVVPCAIMMASMMGSWHRRFARRWTHLATLPGWVVAAFCLDSAFLLLDWI